MISAEELKEIADSKKKTDGIVFAKAMIPKIEEEMIDNAKKGKYELIIGHENDQKWLSDPSFYNIIIDTLREEGFTVYHCDDDRDGTYMIIRW